MNPIPPPSAGLAAGLADSPLSASGSSAARGRTLALDCRAQQCPMPVLRLAKAAAELGPGGHLSIRADDPAFPKDLRAWARSAGARILRFDADADGFEAELVVGGDAGPGSLPSPARRSSPAVPEPVLIPAPTPSPASAPRTAPVLRRRSRPMSAPWMASAPWLGPASLEPVHPTHTPARIAASAPVQPSYSAVQPRTQGQRSSGPAPMTPLGPVRQTFDLRERPTKALPELVARACELAQPGAILAVLADDPQFGPRLEGLLQTIDATLLEFVEHNGHVEARIRVEPPCVTPPCVTATPAPPPREPTPTPVVTPTPARASGPIPSSSARSGTGTLLLGEAPATSLATPSPSSPPTALATRERCTLLVLHNDHESLLAALLVANGAAAQGLDTSVFFSFWGLNLLRGLEPNPAAPPVRVGILQRLLKWMMPKGPARQPLGKLHFAGLGKHMLSSIMREQQLMSLPQLLDSAQELGVRFTVCTMSMAVMGIAPRDLHPYPNLDYGGVASFVEDARGSAIHMVF